MKKYTYLVTYKADIGGRTIESRTQVTRTKPVSNINHIHDMEAVVYRTFKAEDPNITKVVIMHYHLMYETAGFIPKWATNKTSNFWVGLLLVLFLLSNFAINGGLINLAGFAVSTILFLAGLFHLMDDSDGYKVPEKTESEPISIQ